MSGSLLAIAQLAPIGDPNLRAAWTFLLTAGAILVLLLRRHKRRQR